jgi:hypothetical protein
MVDDFRAKKGEEEIFSSESRSSEKKERAFC